MFVIINDVNLGNWKLANDVIQHFKSLKRQFDNTRPHNMNLLFDF